MNLFKWLRKRSEQRIKRRLVYTTAVNDEAFRSAASNKKLIQQPRDQKPE